ncbi:cytochrome c oxidase assembly factor CtaG [Paenisporosarcina sp. OV554]|uniref:cytochrome c oxidase assembly factor CtaG n=1 Tax=Paenisporosarcina sp. OV554 TaxID=2135694 RepID=UPI000D39FF4B|nr:cytochrome c oxidase assembly factor CtaG [Paenisporosarcina sp. OV554]PUB18058.1 putative membrane protein [Paenisporosarcina sp. OV554]
MPLSIFGFQALWSPFFIVSTLFVIALYFFITIKKRHLFEGNVSLTKKEASAFIIAVVLLYIVKGSPADLLGHILFSVHMAQMALLLMLIPPLLITGIPIWIWKALIENRFIKPMFRFFTKPLLALIVFSGMFSIYHIPLVFDVIKQNEWYHILFTLLLFISSLFLWWPIMNKLQGEHQVHGLSKIGYIIASAILITPACALIIFSNHSMYATYTSGEAWLKAMELCVPSSKMASLTLSGPELFSNMSTIEDQRLGGVIMKIIQEVIYGVILGMVFFQWYKSEQENADEITNKALLERQAFAANK